MGPPAPRAPGDRSRPPRARHAGFADAAGGHLAPGRVRGGSPPASDALPGQLVRPRRAARVRRAGAARPGAGGGRSAGALRLRAEDRRAGDLAAIRGTELRAGRDPWRRDDRRGRDRQPADGARHSASPPGGPARRHARGPRRGVHAARRLRGAQRAARARGKAPLRQRAEHGGGDAAPEGPRHHREPQPLGVVLPARGRARARDPLGVAGAREAPGVPGEPEHPTRGGDRGGDRLRRGMGRGTPQSRLRDRWHRHQGRLARRAGAAGLPVPLAALGDRLQVPRAAGHHEARVHRGLRRADRCPDPGRPRDSRLRGRHHGPQRHAPQHRRDQAQGPAGRGHGGPPARR